MKPMTPSTSDLEADMEIWATACGPSGGVETKWNPDRFLNDLSLENQRRTASSILNYASDLVDGPRALQHGDKARNFNNIALAWSAFISAATGSNIALSGWHVATMMMLLKSARTLSGEYSEDDYNDMAGYAGIAGELAGIDHDGL